MTKIEKFCYLFLIRMNLSCPSKVKKTMMKSFEQQLNDYLEQNSSATMDEIKSTFGTPETVAERFLATVDGNVIRKHRRKVRAVKIAVVLALISAVILVYLDLIHEEPGYIIVGAAELVSEESDLAEAAHASPIIETVTKILYQGGKIQ